MDDNLELNIGKVIALKRLREKMLEISDKITELGEPILDDLDLLPEMYEAYKRIFAQRGRPEDAMQVRNRKKFLMVVLYLYSPKALIGDKMLRIGLRRKLSELFGLTTSSPISDNCAGLIVQYRAYADFRRDVNIIFKEICSVLEDRIIITD